MSIKKDLSYALLLLGGVFAIGAAPAAAASITCTVAPEYSALADGESLRLEAVCNGALSSIDWRMDGVSVSGAIPLPGHVAGKPAYFITPVGAGGANSFAFTAVGVPASTANTFGGSNTARVTVKPSSAVVAKAAGVAAPMTPVAASCGSANSGTVAAMPSGVAACSSGESVLQIAGASDFSWTCESLTGGADANCYAKRGTTTTPTTTTPTTTSTTTSTTSVNGTCGPAANVATLVPPPAGRCAAGSTAGPIITSSMQYSWSCSGSGGGTTASCSAKRNYTVTATAGAGGTITPASKTVAAYGTTTFTVAPAAGYAATVTGCGGTLSGSTYTTGQVYANCAVAATFKATTTATASTTGSATDPGTGLWVPPNTTGRLIADQSGPTAAYLSSYVPGCLNGNYIVSSWNTGCGANSSFTGTVSGTSTTTTFAFGAGRVLGLRYMSKATAGTALRYFTMASADGGNTGSMSVWLSDSPTATYDGTSTACKSTSTTQPYVLTGPGYCPIVANKRYYLFMSTTRTDAGLRYLVNEGGADFY